MTVRNLTPPFAFGAVVLSIAACILLPTAITLFLFVFIQVLSLGWLIHGAGTLRFSLLAILIFSIPLLLIHGILNPAYPVSMHWGFLPVRFNGILYAVPVALRILILCLGLVIWRHVPGMQLLAAAERCRLPLTIQMLLAVASTFTKTLSRRIKIVYVAQQARGIPAGPGLFLRIRAFPKSLIPLIVSTLNEAAARGSVMVSRGLGTTKVMWPAQSAPCRTIERIILIIQLGALGAAWMIR
jgi:energy-coupling factor transporter transmembrane protein EcfT